MTLLPPDRLRAFLVLLAAGLAACGDSGGSDSDGGSGIADAVGDQVGPDLSPTEEAAAIDSGWGLDGDGGDGDGAEDGDHDGGSGIADVN